MKVIHRNIKKAPKKWKERCSCGSCESILEVDQDDLLIQSGQDVCVGTKWNFVVFRCPCCECYCSIDVPNTVRLKLSDSGVVSLMLPVEAKIIVMRGVD